MRYEDLLAKRQSLDKHSPTILWRAGQLQDRQAISAFHPSRPPHRLNSRPYITRVCGLRKPPLPYYLKERSGTRVSRAPPVLQSGWYRRKLLIGKRTSGSDNHMPPCLLRGQGFPSNSIGDSLFMPIQIVGTGLSSINHIPTRKNIRNPQVDFGWVVEWIQLRMLERAANSKQASL